MIISENQLKGIITACLLLAIIPFLSLLTNALTKYKIPDHTRQCEGCTEIEIYKNNQTEGVYFVLPGTKINDFLKSAGIRQKSDQDFILENPVRLMIGNTLAVNNVIIAPMPQAARFSLGLPMNINEVTQEDLLLIKGIGEETAGRIILLRNRMKHFHDINQLKEITGIKEKRISEMRKYLYVETN